MKIILAVLLSVIMISSLYDASAQESEPIILEQLSPSGQMLVKLEWPEVYPDEIYTFKVSFYDPATGKLLDNDTRLNYNVYITQFDHEVETYMHNLAINGAGEFDVLFAPEHEGLAEVIVELRVASHTSGDFTEYNEKVNFSVNVVPEFGVIAMIVLIAAFVPILLISKTRLFPKF